MSSPQGKTGTILGVTQLEGIMFYVKQNPCVQLTDIEYRIYQAAGKEIGLEDIIPLTFRAYDPTILLVQAAGESLENILHRPSELQQTREQFSGFLQQNLAVRGALNKVINQTLTVEDQQFLMEYNRERLLRSMKQIAPERKEISAEDMEEHFWAYRVMNAVGVYDAQFKHDYTAVIGSKIDELLTRRGGTWLQDNCIRNNASPNGTVMIPFDFNSLHYGLPQMDEAGMTGLYLFNGPLGVFDSVEERERFIESRAKESGEEDIELYKKGYLLSAIHQNALLAGYRTQEAKQLKKQFDETGKNNRELHYNFCKAFDEIEYQHSACVEALRPWNRCVSSIAATQEEYETIRRIDSFITHNTFGQRVRMMF